MVGGGALDRTLLFIHGTGVRADGYLKSLDLIERRVAERGLAGRVLGCYWGGSQGARLEHEGRSVPEYAAAGGGPPGEEDELIALWAILYTDPWYELRVLRNLPKQPSSFGKEPPSAELERRLGEFTPSPELAALLRLAGLHDGFEEALKALRAAPEWRQAAETAPADPLDHRRAAARALIAYTLVAAEQAGEPPPEGSVRDALTERLGNELKGHGLALGDHVKRLIGGLAWGPSWQLRRRRGGYTDAVVPASGDVMKFLANGDGVRSFVAKAIADAGSGPGSVILLAHSLGGMICADLLVREPREQVAALVTAGSQTPFLYEIDAFPGLRSREPLPGHFPRWLNVYDPRDMLGYAGEGVFGDRIQDARVNNRQPFPQAHSAYWSNGAVWDAIAEFLR